MEEICGGEELHQNTDRGGLMAVKRRMRRSHLHLTRVDPSVKAEKILLANYRHFCLNGLGANVQAIQLQFKFPSFNIRYIYLIRNFGQVKLHVVNSTNTLQILLRKFSKEVYAKA